MPISFRANITREQLRSQRSTLFVFGDNLAQTGFGGQAKEMRGEPNAVGLPTKRLPNMEPNAFLKDSDWRLIHQTVSAASGKLFTHLLRGGTVVWPRDGIGTGLAQLEKHAPEIAKFYERLRDSLAKVTL